MPTNEPDFSGVFDINDTNADGEDNPQTAAAGEEIDHTAAKEDRAEPGDTEQDPAAPAAEGQAKAEGEGKKQTPEENAAYAAIRRKYEAQMTEKVKLAEQAAMEKARKQINDQLTEVGMLNPWENKPITNSDELAAYLKQRAEEDQISLVDELKEKGVTEVEIKKLLENHPDVISARRAYAELETLKSREEAKQIIHRLEEEIAEIHKIDPSVSSIDDLKKSPDLPAIQAKLKRGYTLTDAFYIVNSDKIAATTAAKAEQAVKNRMNGKGHLGRNTAEGAGGVEVPAEIMKEFRNLLPNASAEEIRRYYQKDLTHLKK